MTIISKVMNIFHSRSIVQLIYCSRGVESRFPQHLYHATFGQRGSDRSRPRNNLSSRFARVVLFGLGVGLGIGINIYRRHTKNGVSPLNNFKPVENVEKVSQRNNFIADVVEKTAPAVVYIEITGSYPFIKQPIPIASGSGFIVESDGLILTNAHVVANQKLVTIKLCDGRIFQGIVESRDMQIDLATIRINASGLPTLPLSQMAKLRPGEWVVAMGSPLSLSNTITAGVISSIHRASDELGLEESEMEFIQTDASINFGNSGGPLVNLDGEVIGINTMSVTAGIHFAIPADYAQKFLDEAKQRRIGGWWKTDEDKKLNRHYLGVTILTLTPSIIQELEQRHFNFPKVQNGVLIWKIMVNSPAYRGGVQAGDIITHIDGKEVMSSQDVYKEVETGQELILTVRRQKETYTLIVQPQEVDLDI